MEACCCSKLQRKRDDGRFSSVAKIAPTAPSTTRSGRSSAAPAAHRPWQGLESGHGTGQNAQIAANFPPLTAHPPAVTPHQQKQDSAALRNRSGMRFLVDFNRRTQFTDFDSSPGEMSNALEGLLCNEKFHSQQAMTRKSSEIDSEKSKFSTTNAAGYGLYIFVSHKHTHTPLSFDCPLCVCLSSGGQNYDVFLDQRL